jgi:predicted NAD-dependent protein-ADP-ribosyltransferase YbiA (DUF1768 family)
MGGSMSWSEHYQAAKCTDPVGQEEIRNARSPLLAKELANGKFWTARDPEWDSRKLDVLEEILRAKVVQHPEAREALRESRDDEIVEDSPTTFGARGQTVPARTCLANSR